MLELTLPQLFFAAVVPSGYYTVGTVVTNNNPALSVNRWRIRDETTWFMMNFVASYRTVFKVNANDALGNLCRT